MSITSALSKLLTKMGGTPASGDNTDELLNKISDAYSGSGGDCNVFLVNAEPDPDAEVGEGEDTPLITDKTYAEVIEARDNGLLVVFMYRYSSDEPPQPYIFDGYHAYPIAVGAYLAQSLCGFTDFQFDRIVYDEETDSFALRVRNPTFGSIVYITLETDPETGDQRYIPDSSYDDFYDAFANAVETNYPIRAVVNDIAARERRTVSLIMVQPINNWEDFCAVFQETVARLDSGTCGISYLIVATDSVSEEVIITDVEPI